MSRPENPSTLTQRGEDRMTQFDTTTATAVRAHVAILRGLYGDLAENLHDSDECNDLWDQIEHEQAQLAALVQRVGVPA
jgi:hypothetical protein